jgi:hypothetical protein
MMKATVALGRSPARWLGTRGRHSSARGGTMPGGGCSGDWRSYAIDIDDTVSRAESRALRLHGRRKRICFLLRSWQ